MIEGLSAKPPRREVAMQLDGVMKNLVQRRILEKMLVVSQARMEGMSKGRVEEVER